MSSWHSLNMGRLACRFALIAVLLLSVGCTTAPRFSATVDAIAVEGDVNHSYVLKPVVDGVDSADLHFREYAGYIHSALESQGLVRAQSAQDASIEIEVNYGAKRDHRIVSSPSLYTDLQRTQRVCQRRDRNGRCRLWQTRSVPREPPELDNRLRDDFRVLSYYRLFIALEAIDIKNSAEREVLWSTRARTNRTNPDLRTAMPLLVAAASQYVGRDTGREVPVVLQLDDHGQPKPAE